MSPLGKGRSCRWSVVPQGRRLPAVTVLGWDTRPPPRAPGLQSCVGVLRDDLEVYNPVQCLRDILTDQHFSRATFILFLFKKINSFNCTSLILTYAMSSPLQLDGPVSTGLQEGIK